ncbi:hypothetical protein ABZ249_30200 [Nocardiopsis sp. NPDC006139]|uniref:hypothetical protein n=1 Tax=Nocardiopsis sp. NPDC006139 TaxID=3154578 RepID=UPI0033B1968F
MSTTTTRCWAFTHAEGPTKGDPYEYGEGAPHFPTREAALEWLGSLNDHPNLNLAELTHECHTVTCATCGGSDDEFHYTTQEAEAAARDWDCPTCA